jgi:hypothetical protein
MPYLLAGPFVALIGIVAIFFVLRRKSVEKRSMYSARRSQIEHKVRAARQRTLAPRGRSQKPAEQTIPGATEAPSPFATQAQQAATYEAPAYEAPPVAPPPAPTFPSPKQAPSASPWDVPAAASAPAPTFDYPPAAPEPAYTPPAPAPEPPPAPSEPAWTPAPRPAESVPPAPSVAPAASATSATSAGGWSVVSTEKESAATVPPHGKKKKKGKAEEAATGSWSLASGDMLGAEAEEAEVRRPSAIMAIAQYAVLVVGLVMVLIGVLVMVANAHIT